MSEIRDELVAAFPEPEFRRGYAESFLSPYIAAQIKFNREARKLSQRALGDLIGGTDQGRVSKLEDANYRSWTVKTLQRIAAAFDLVLLVKFVSFGEFLDEATALDRASLTKPGFPQDAAFHKTSTGSSNASIAKITDSRKWNRPDNTQVAGGVVAEARGLAQVGFGNG
jgi:transcriptional regulator with XRE-family HTH domain